MSRYTKESHRLTVQFYDSDNMSELLFEIPDRNVMNIAELFSDHYVNMIVQDYLGEDAPDSITVLVLGEYNK